MPRPAGGPPLARAVPPWTGAAAVLAAALLWSTTGTASAFRPEGASTLSVAAARIVLGGALLAAWAAYRGDLHPVLRATSHRRLVGVGALAVAVYQLAFFTAVGTTGVAVGTVVGIGSAPVLTGLLTRFTHRAPLSRRWMVSTGVAVAGCTVLVLGGASAGVRPVGIALALVAGLAYAGYAVTAATLIDAGLPSTGVMAGLFAGGGLLLLPVLLLTGPGWLLTPSGAVVALHLAVLTTAVSYVLYGWGLRTVAVSTAATLSLAEPAGAAVLGLVVLDEPLRVTTVVGLVTVVLALALLTVRRRSTV